VAFLYDFLSMEEKSDAREQDTGARGSGRPLKLRERRRRQQGQHNA
jgi:hypothetical protein